MLKNDPRDQRIAELESKLAWALETIDKLVSENASLKKRVADLESRINQKSHNSDKPPSSDGPGASPRRKEPSGKKRGGQVGHEPNKRDLLPPDRVIDVPLPACPDCDSPLDDKREHSQTLQLIELPEIRPHVTHFRMWQKWCSCCGKWMSAPLPVEISKGEQGPRLNAFVALMTGKLRVSKRAVSEFLWDVFQIPLCEGAVCKTEQRISDALKAPYDEALEHVQNQEAVHMDETGWREDKKKAWLWVIASAAVAVFQVARSRSASVAKELLGLGFQGHLHSDRYNAYNWFDLKRRQLCWAHIKRAFEGFAERGKSGKRLGKKLLAETDSMFALWHRVRDGTLTREDFQRKMRPIQRQIEQLLAGAAVCDDARTCSIAHEIFQVKEALWTFIDEPGLEPTNNHAERCLRPAVLWRKGSFGTDSVVGSRYAERMMTVTTSLRLQNRNVLDFLVEAYEAKLYGRFAPSLLPQAA